MTPLELALVTLLLWTSSWALAMTIMAWAYYEGESNMWRVSAGLCLLGPFALPIFLLAWLRGGRIEKKAARLKA